MGFIRLHFGMVCVIISSGIFGTSVGMLLPLLPLRLNSLGVEPMLIGLNAAASSIAIMLVAPNMHRLVNMFGLVNTVLGGMVLFAVPMTLLAYTDDLLAWFGLRFVLGVGVALLWIGEELWVNASAPDHIRGRVIAVYAGVFSAATAVGPMMLNTVGLDGDAPFLLTSGFALASGVLIIVARRHVPDVQGDSHISFKSVFKLIPLLLLAGSMSGLANGSAWSFLSLYGLQVGLQEAAAVLTTSVHLLGGLILQLPVGWLADRMTGPALLAWTGAIGAAATALIWFTGAGSPVFWAAIFIAGGCTMGIYTVSLASLGRRFAGGGMAAATAAYIMCFEVGILMGGPVTGTAIQFMGAPGLLLMMGGGCMVVMLGGIIGRARRAVTS